MNIHNVQSEFQGSFTTKRTSTRYLVVHHAAALYPTRNGIDDVRAVARFHTVDRGWGGIGYHICLAEATPDGPIERFDVSDERLQRAHILDRNDECLGVSCLTNFTGMPAQKWFDALAETLRDLNTRYPTAQIVGHKEIAVPRGQTSCPGPLWHQWKARLIAAVGVSGPVPLQPWGTFPVHSAFKTYYERSGGLWQPDRYCLGWAVSEFDQNTRTQKFERGALRLRQDGTIEALLRSEW